MHWTDEPKLKTKHQVLDPIEWETDLELVLPIAKQLPEITLSKVLEQRETRRIFRPLDLNTLSNFLYHSLRVREQIRQNSGSMLIKKPVISAGSIHSTNCLLSIYNKPNQWYYYDGIKHSLKRLKVESETPFSLLAKARSMLLETSNSTVLWYICDLERLSSKYENPETLAYRDIGAVLSTQSLIAESLGLTFCPLGITGSTEAKSLHKRRHILGGGLALLGAR
jgi:SagB-type dehydrogenase family enzyme